MTIEQRIWDWMPKRRTRARVTTPVVVAANLGLPVAEVTAAMDRMIRAYQLVSDPRGGYHRGIPIAPPPSGRMQANEGSDG